VWQFLPEARQPCQWWDDRRVRQAVAVTHPVTLPADPDAVAHFAAKLRHETDPSDVAAARAAGEPLVLVDVRSREAWDAGHVPGALHLPGGELADRLAELPPPEDHPHLVVYCWGPGCNGSTKAALVLARAGYRHVREMIGGFEYWAREGLAVQTTSGRTRREVDPLTGVPA
jgi:rhodanese-related sulfurtransferase